MKWINVKQGSEEWLAARRGIPTASQFHRIITPKKLTASSQVEKYLSELVAERVTGATIVDAQSMWMERGSELEKTAAAGYEFEHGVPIEECGFAVTDDGFVGCSPDRLVGGHGLLEIKCPTAQTQIRYLLFGLEDEYKLQMQGQMWVTGRHFVDFRSECPGLPAFEEHVRLDLEVQAQLSKALPLFVNAVSAAHTKILSLMSESNQEVANG